MKDILNFWEYLKRDSRQDIDSRIYYRERMLKASVTLVLIACMYLFINGILYPARLPFVYNLSLLTIALLQFLTLSLLKRGRISIASLITIIPIFLSTILGYLSRDELLYLPLIPIILSGILLNIRFMIGFTCTAITILVSLQFVNIPFQLGSGSDLSLRLFIFFLMYIFIPVLMIVHLMRIREAEALNLELQIKADRTKLQQEFTQNMTHDFRTPLTNIMTQIYLLQRKYPLEDDIAEKINRIDSHATRIRDMLNDLDELQKLESYSTQNLEKDSVKVASLVSQIVEAHRDYAQEKQIEFNYQPLDLPISIKGDEKLLKTLFTHIIENGLNYTQQGGQITVRFEIQTSIIYVVIEDDGIGISSEDQALIFNRFYRANPARTSQERVGTGIGLTIALYIAKLHQGTITVDSQLGKGSQFTVSLPIASNP